MSPVVANTTNAVDHQPLWFCVTAHGIRGCVAASAYNNIGKHRLRRGAYGDAVRSRVVGARLVTFTASSMRRSNSVNRLSLNLDVRCAQLLASKRRMMMACCPRYVGDESRDGGRVIRATAGVPDLP